MWRFVGTTAGGGGVGSLAGVSSGSRPLMTVLITLGASTIAAAVAAVVAIATSPTFQLPRNVRALGASQLTPAQQAEVLKASLDNRRHSATRHSTSRRRRRASP